MGTGGGNTKGVRGNPTCGERGGEQNPKWALKGKGGRKKGTQLGRENDNVLQT